MAKIIIASLFAYDPLISYKKVKEPDEEKYIEYEEVTWQKEIEDSIAKRVANEIVQSIMLCAMKMEVDNLVLMLDNITDPVQDEALRILKDKIENGAQVETRRVNGNDMFSVAKEVVEVIESFKNDDEISVNVASMKNAKTLGMIYGTYARSDRVKILFYVNKMTKQIVRLLKIPLRLTTKQKKLLGYLRAIKNGSIERDKKTDYERLKMEKSSFYDILGEMKKKGFVEENNQISELGEIALL